MRFRENKKKVLFATSIIIIILIINSILSISQECIDEDNDKICDDADKCLNSMPGERVDEHGCDPFQFCAQFYCSLDCFTADFLDNENTVPYDCTVVFILNEGTYEPKCVPIECKKQLKIPNSTIQVKIRVGTQSYFKTTLFDIPPGFDVNSSTYLSWCVDEDTFFAPGTIYNARLYSSYDPNLNTTCPRCFDEDWDKVNYIINHKQGSIDDVQAAIAYFIDGGLYPSDPDAIAMVEQALLYGEEFWPQEGQFMAIIVDIGNLKQLTFIEVDP